MKMRIVGISDNWIWIQTYNRVHRVWNQTRMNFAEFDTWMANNFPKHYTKKNPDKSTAEFFYSYGETKEMKRHGDAYVYEEV